MLAETRFARGPGGPVPYRVDGAGDRRLLLISDWGAPYGEPGAESFAQFAAQLAQAGVETITVLDGTTRQRETSSAPDRRVSAARSVAEETDLHNATLLGVADGAPVAATLASAEPERFSRLVLYDTFEADVAPTWALNDSGGSDLGDVAELGDLAAKMDVASHAFDIAKKLWKTVPNKSQQPPGVPPGGSSPKRPPSAEELSALMPQMPAVPGPKGGGLAELLRNVAQLEGRLRSGHQLEAIAVPTLVLESRPSAESDGSLGVEIASRIPGARHRVVAGGSRWPWTASERVAQLIELSGATLAAPELQPVQPDIEPDRVLATVMFTDIVGSTERLAELGDQAWRGLLERHHAIVRSELSRFGGREIDTAGDGFLASFDAPARAVRCAVAARDQVREIGLSIRCGLHTGECERVCDKLVGIAVHIGARIASQAQGDEVLVSGTLRDLVAGSGIDFVSRGTTSLKGLPGEWPLFAVSGVTTQNQAPSA